MYQNSTKNGMDTIPYVSNISSIYQKGNVRLINADCMDIMKQYPDKYFDLAVVDPPYKNEVEGLKAGYNSNLRKQFSYEYFQAPTKKYLTELKRISKNQIIWGFNYFLEILENTDTVLVWNKHQNGHFSECELAWSNIGKTRIFDYPFTRDLYNKIHPTQKPKALYNWIFKYYSNKKMKIIDTHLGSGSSAIAAYYFGFSEFIGCEIDAEYFEKSIKRFEVETMQQVLSL